MKNYKEVLVESVHFNDLDLLPPYYDIGSEEDNHFEYDKNIISDTEVMRIDLAIAALTRMRAAGADHVYFVADGDHHGYIITGVKMEEV